MSGRVKKQTIQTKIPFSERKLRPRIKCKTPCKSDYSSDENSPVKGKSKNINEFKRAARKSLSELQLKSSRCNSIEKLRRTPKRNKCKQDDEEDDDNDDVHQTPTPSKRHCPPVDLDNAFRPSTSKLKTPSSVFSKLTLDSPVVESNSRNNLKPKELFPNSEVSSARKAFHSSQSQELPCREEELKKLTDFLMKHLNEKSSGSLYVSGLPGTGKTASLNCVIQQDKIASSYQIVKINCTSINSSGSIYKRICEELKIKLSHKNEKEALSAIERYLVRKHKMILLILDEIDQLETKNQSVLYTIFEWPSLKNTRLVLVGIANAMDLTDRILPRLCAKVELKPTLMHFAPYSKEQISKILSHRLSEAGANGVFAPKAIELISAKVAGMSGDIRKALDLGRRVMEMAEEKTEAPKSEITPKKKANSEDCSARKSLVAALEVAAAEEIKKPSRKLTFDVEDPTEESNDRRDKQKIHSAKSPRKRSRSPKVVESTPKKSPRKPSGRKESCCEETTPRKLNFKTAPKEERKDGEGFRKSPRKLHFNEEHLAVINNSNPAPKKSPRKLNFNLSPSKSIFESPIRKSPRKLGVPFSPNFKAELSFKSSPRKISAPFSPNCKTNVAVRSSPRKLNFNVDAKDVLNVVKNIYGSSKNFKSTEESSFPLHQKLLICTFLLVSKRGKAKDLNVGRLHQVYTKICSKRAISAVDRSGFLFLCRQIEMTGVIQIGKGPGKLAKVQLLWDETEITNSLKDLNLLSSILNDTACLN